MVPAKRHTRHAYCAPDGGSQRASYAGIAFAEAAEVLLPLLSCAGVAGVADTTSAAVLGAMLPAPGVRDEKYCAAASGSA